MDYSYDVYAVTEDCIELWEENLTYKQASQEVENATREFGGRYWFVRSTGYLPPV